MIRHFELATSLSKALEVSMNPKNSFVLCSVLALILLASSCVKEPENVALSADGVKVSFTQMGKGTPAIVFVHGWANRASIWDETMSHFSGKYQTVAVDLYGSDESYNNRKDWSMAMFGEDVAAVVKKLKLNQVALVGFSMGGAVIAETAKLVPDKITGLVLVDVLQDVEMKYTPEMVAAMDSVLMDIVAAPTNEKLVNGGFYKKNQEKAFQRVERMLKSSSRTGWRRSLQSYFKWINEDCIDSFKRIKAPVTAINSDMEPTKVETFRKYAPSFQARIIPNVGHLVFWDNPEEFNRLLEESIQEFVNRTK
jgi:pimeloyl-ACP methyl ester carboxylesterase